MATENKISLKENSDLSKSSTDEETCKELNEMKKSNNEA